MLNTVEINYESIELTITFLPQLNNEINKVLLDKLEVKVMFLDNFIYSKGFQKGIFNFQGMSRINLNQWI